MPTEGSDEEEEIFSANTFEEESRAEENTRVWKTCNLAAYFDSHDLTSQDHTTELQ